MVLLRAIMYACQGDTYCRPGRREQIFWDYRRKIWEKCLKINGICGKTDFFFWILLFDFIHKQILWAKSCSEVIYRYLIVEIFKLFLIKSCVYETNQINLTSNLPQRPKYQYFTSRKTLISYFTSITTSIKTFSGERVSIFIYRITWIYHFITINNISFY